VTKGHHQARRAITLALALLLCLCTAALAGDERGVLLSPDDLTALRPAYEAFLNQLADRIIARDLLREDEREAWLMYQLGDYFQNGPYGMIAAMFTPDLLAWARPQDSLLRLEKAVSGGTLRVDTVGAYAPLDSILPGLLLETSLIGRDGLPVLCRFRWGASQGGFVAWNALTAQEMDVGNSFINDGRPFYWTDQPPAANAVGDWVINVEILGAEDDTALGSAAITLTPQDGGWALGPQALR
jgi:hypothetical protein